MKAALPIIEEFGTDMRPRPSEPATPATSAPPSGREQRPLANCVQWACLPNNEYIGVGTTISTLPPGMYGLGNRNEDPLFTQLPIKVDELLSFPDSLSESVLREIDSFWQRGHLFKEYGFLHRRGYLFYGPMGSGKSCLIAQIVDAIIKRKGIVFIAQNPSLLIFCLRRFREIEPERQVICLFEDIDALIETHGENQYLSALDGEHQIDRVLNLATTNYPERLDKRIVQRPRRFDRIIKIDMPSDKIRRVYFQKKLNIGDEELDKWVQATDGFSFAACAELVVSVKCLGNDFDDSVQKLSLMTAVKVSSAEFNNSRMGFSQV